MEGPGFSDVLRAAQQGEEGALDALLLRYRPALEARLRGRLRGVLRRRHDTADLAQSVLVEVLRDLPRFEDRGERAFRHWLYVKAENKVRMKLRKELDARGQRRERTLDGADAPLSAPGPRTSAEEAEEAAKLETLLRGLAAEQREILLLRGRDDLPFRAIAERLALPSADAARKRYARALVELRQRWAST